MAGLFKTGSVDVFRYNINTDQHDLIEILYRPFETTDDILLAAESASVLSHSLHTELYGYDLINRDKDIAVDLFGYISTIEDAYGQALDFYDRKLAVGCKYFWDQLIFNSGSVFDVSGSLVDIWDYSFTERDQFTYNDPPRNVGYGLVIGGVISSAFGYSASYDWRGFDTSSKNLYYENIYVPPGYDELWVYGRISITDPLAIVTKIPVSVDGQYTTFFFDLTLPSLFTAYSGYIKTDPQRFRVYNPHIEVTSSFGHSVSLNADWLAIGSPEVSASTGAVYLYKNQTTGSTLSWSLHQILEPSSGSTYDWYGHAVSLNKGLDYETQYGNPNRLVVGSGAPESEYVYVYELSASTWKETYKFVPEIYNLYPLTFDPTNYPILMSSSYQTSSFGYSVSTYNNTVVIGAPTDRRIYEYTGSSQYPQGAVYVFEKCAPSTNCEGWYLDRKFYGNEYSLKTNKFGYSVSVYGNNIAAGLPKYNVGLLTGSLTGSSDFPSSCYIEGSITQQNYCGADLKNTINGQWFYLTKNTSSLSWDVAKVYQKKKRFLSPFRSLGVSVSVGDKSIVTGAPMMIGDTNRDFNIPFTSSLGIPLDDVSGKGYIYNLHNYKDKFYVGNVFYRNGKMVINTSGSAFKGLFFNAVSPYGYEYVWNYKSKQTLLEKQVVCTVEPGEFNVSTNPTAISRTSSSFDLNKNGIFDFQDADVLLRYMQYRATKPSGTTLFDWSSSALRAEDEISYYNYNASLWENTDSLFSSSLRRFENVDTWFASVLDFNQDNRIDLNDIWIMWKYSCNRLTQENYSTYINSNCTRQLVTDALDYIENFTQRNDTPMIKSDFLDYDEASAVDKTGSFLAPLVTTVGLYDGLDLVAVAKLGTPVKLPKTLPINFVVKMDF